MNRTSWHLMRAICCVAALSSFGASRGAAAIITWSGVQTSSSDLDISTTGSLVAAYNLGASGVGSTTINGVTFSPLVLSGSSPITVGNVNFTTSGSFISSNSIAGVSAPFTSLSAAYQTLLSSIAGTNGVNFTMTLAGLTIGNSYQFQWFLTDSVISNFQTTATAGIGVTLNSNVSNTNGGVGQYVNGSFTADATSQSISFNAASGLRAINGFQLREAAAVPEPSTWALVGCGVMAVLARKRRNRS